ncbi:MAG: acyltransferase, partial [Proteobacteria bacterium]|nr:acyltransferase [Pseudomonadota bacterium]
NTPFEVHDIGKAKVGMMICFDWLFPEAARTLALKGADIICHPSNLVLPHCPQAMITRCLENRVFAVTANRVGSEARVGKERLTFIGKSQIVSPDGKVLVRASSTRTAARVVEIDPKVARKKDINPKNDVLDDRRRALYNL